MFLWLRVSPSLPTEWRFHQGSSGAAALSARSAPSPQPDLGTPTALMDVDMTEAEEQASSPMSGGGFSASIVADAVHPGWFGGHIQRGPAPARGYLYPPDPRAPTRAAAAAAGMAFEASASALAEPRFGSAGVGVVGGGEPAGGEAVSLYMEEAYGQHPGEPRCLPFWGRCP